MSNEQKFTVFAGSDADKRDYGWLSSDWHEAGSLDELIREIHGRPTAWAPVHVGAFDTEEADRVFAESIAAGRIIEKVGDRFIPRGVQAEPKQLFEVGKVYRRRMGDVVRLIYIDCKTHEEKWEAARPGHRFATVDVLTGNGDTRYVSLMDGASVSDNRYNLLPGELIFRDGQWIAADEEKTETIPGKKLLETLNKRLGGGWVTTPVDFQIGFRKQTTEPNRPRLTWADTKPSDRWDGYTVKKRDFTPDGDSREQSGLCLSPDLSEVSPLCGSAWLVLGE